MLIEFGVASSLTRGSYFSADNLDGHSLLINGIRYYTRPLAPDEPLALPATGEEP